MFLAGADGKTPELRASSIKGALRFWWRALNGHLSLKELKEREGKIFGNTEQQSRVIILCKNKIAFERQYKLVAHKGNPIKSSPIGEQFEIILKISQKIPLGDEYIFDIEKLKALFEVFCLLGGLGRRARRANGQLKIVSYKLDNLETKYSSVLFGKTLVEKLNLLSLDKNSPFSLGGSNNIIKTTFSNLRQPIPHIYSIEKIILKGNKSCSNLREIISKATHNTKSKKNEWSYSEYIGSGTPRFASPIIFAIYEENSPYILVTKLKTVKEIKNRYKIVNEDCYEIQQKLINHVKKS